MCGARATPTLSVKLNLGGQCRGYRIREVESGHSDCGYHIREVGSVTGGEPRCVAHAPLFRIREVEPGRSVQWLPYP
ncbi:hypothetical protein D3C87_1660120 [compost metagenome]